MLEVSPPPRQGPHLLGLNDGSPRLPAVQPEVHERLEERQRERAMSAQVPFTMMPTQDLSRLFVKWAC